ncbi:hypothetical protein TevJSym_ah00450 [endosymbiont of Tevnia jerichonana (vent Tica)]|uniref:Uncharacterized protein n=1 Tax=endosymbiont of Tevnia jerichonana (vent Tica) TaxID=1049564 RepID=G2FE96_9GAMM|nr:hypothetical protein TevJSym_ah00450 [endosymbiont of Tevnia jerichonana (vent Tica)]
MWLLQIHQQTARALLPTQQGVIEADANRGTLQLSPLQASVAAFKTQLLQWLREARQVELGDADQEVFPAGRWLEQLQVDPFGAPAGSGETAELQRQPAAGKDRVKQKCKQ